jgi:hypothetical protein
MLDKAVKKLGTRAAGIGPEDLTVKYNWWSGKEPKKIPQLYDLDDADDFEGILSAFRSNFEVYNRRFISQ